MNKILRISMIAVLALIANFSFAGVSTIDFTKLAVKTVSDENNKENNGYTFTSGDFNFTTKKNNGQTAPTQNTNTKDLRHYAKNTITISGAKMTKWSLQCLMRVKTMGNSDCIRRHNDCG